MFPAARPAFTITVLETSPGRPPSLIWAAASASYTPLLLPPVVLNQLEKQNMLFRSVGRGERNRTCARVHVLARFPGPQSQRRQLKLIPSCERAAPLKEPVWRRGGVSGRGRSAADVKAVVTTAPALF